MNTLKPLLTVAVLAGIGYGVYVRINSGADAPPPAGIAAGWDTTPKVQLGDVAAPAGAPAWAAPGIPSSPPMAPPFGAPRGGSEAPPYNPSAPVASAPPAGGAPPYAPAEVVAGSQAPPTAHITNPSAVPPASNDPMPPLPPANNPYASLPPQDSAPPQSVGPPQTAPPISSPPQSVGLPAGSSPSPYVPPPAAPSAVAGGNPNAQNLPSNPAISVAPVAPGVVVNYAAVMEVAKRDLEAGQMASALRQLSSCYDSPQLSPTEQQQITQMLDQVAGTVVYSTQHMLEAPYEVQPGERLEDIGQRYNVPWQLLAKINGIDDPQSMRPGERLKVVRGPFSAVVSLEKKQLTLLLADGSYAGRFAIGLGREQPPREGVYAVSDKVVNPVYHGRDRAISADDVNNPYGERWIGLGNDMGIHGTDRPENVGRTDLSGSISLSPRDAEDVFDILSLGSKVTIRR